MKATKQRYEAKQMNSSSKALASRPQSVHLQLARVDRDRPAVPETGRHTSVLGTQEVEEEEDEGEESSFPGGRRRGGAAPLSSMKSLSEEMKVFHLH